MVWMAHNTVAIRPFACSCSPLYCQTEVIHMTVRTATLGRISSLHGRSSAER